MEPTSDIADFIRRDLCLRGKTKPVLVTGTTGPARSSSSTKSTGSRLLWRAFAAGCEMQAFMSTRRSCSARRKS